MKQTKAILIMSACMMLFAACSKKSSSEPAVFQRTLEVAAESGSQTYTASDLKKDIANLSSTATWLTATKQPYSNGSPKVTLDYSENTGNERQAVVTITDSDDNKVVLTVKQLKPGEKPKTKPDQEDDDYGIDDPHDTVTDQPAYSRQK